MTYEHSAAHRAFIDQLNELREQASGPSFAELERLSQRPLPAGMPARRVLAASTTQEILKGKRVGVPPWPWVISYVDTCHEAAREVRLDLGPVDVDAWKKRWLHARNSDPVGPIPDARPVASPSAAVRPEPSNVDRLTAEETVRCYRNDHGRVAARLADLAVHGDPEACFRLALVTVLRGWGHDSQEWLDRAIAAGHAEAAALRSSPDMRAEAAAIAYRLGCDLETGGSAKSSVARFFFQLAAETGHSQAITKLDDAGVRTRLQSGPMPLSAPIIDIVPAGSLRPELDEDFLDRFRDQFNDQHFSDHWANAAAVIESGPGHWIGAGEP